MSCKHTLLRGVHKGKQCGKPAGAGQHSRCYKHMIVDGAPAWVRQALQVPKGFVLPTEPVLLEKIENNPRHERQLTLTLNKISTVSFTCECGRGATFTFKCECMRD